MKKRSDQFPNLMQNFTRDIICVFYRKNVAEGISKDKITTMNLRIVVPNLSLPRLQLGWFRGLIHALFGRDHANQLHILLSRRLKNVSEGRYNSKPAVGLAALQVFALGVNDVHVFLAEALGPGHTLITNHSSPFSKVKGVCSVLLGFYASHPHDKSQKFRSL